MFLVYYYKNTIITALWIGCMHSLINKQTLSRLSNVTAQLSPTEIKARLYFTQTDVNRRLLQPNRGFALLHEPGEELLDVLLQLQRNTHRLKS